MADDSPTYRSSPVVTADETCPPRFFSHSSPLLTSSPSLPASQGGLFLPLSPSLSPPPLPFPFHPARHSQTALANYEVSVLVVLVVRISSPQRWNDALCRVVSVRRCHAGRGTRREKDVSKEEEGGRRKSRGGGGMALASTLSRSESYFSFRPLSHYRFPQPLLVANWGQRPELPDFFGPYPLKTTQAEFFFKCTRSPFIAPFY